MGQSEPAQETRKLAQSRGSGQPQQGHTTQVTSTPHRDTGQAVLVGVLPAASPITHIHKSSSLGCPKAPPASSSPF